MLFCSVVFNGDVTLRLRDLAVTLKINYVANVNQDFFSENMELKRLNLCLNFSGRPLRDL